MLSFFFFFWSFPPCLSAPPPFPPLPSLSLYHRSVSFSPTDCFCCCCCFPLARQLKALSLFYLGGVEQKFDNTNNHVLFSFISFLLKPAQQMASRPPSKPGKAKQCNFFFGTRRTKEIERSHACGLAVEERMYAQYHKYTNIY